METSSKRLNAGLSLAILLAILGLGLWVCLPGLGRESLWGDEINLAYPALQPTVSETMELVQKPHSVGYPVFLHYWMKAGTGETFLRLPSLACGVLSLLLLYLFLDRVGSRRVALTAAFFLALSPAHVRFSREVAAYSPQIAVLIGAALFWIRALEGNR